MRNEKLRKPLLRKAGLIKTLCWMCFFTVLNIQIQVADVFLQAEQF